MWTVSLAPAISLLNKAPHVGCTTGCNLPNWGQGQKMSASEREAVRVASNGREALSLTAATYPRGAQERLWMQPALHLNLISKHCLGRRCICTFIYRLTALFTLSRYTLLGPVVFCLPSLGRQRHRLSFAVGSKECLQTQMPTEARGRQPQKTLGMVGSLGNS